MPLPAQSALSVTESAPGGMILQPLRVKNMEPNTSVFAKTLNGDPTFRVTFAAKGHEGDTQRMPVAIAQDTEFLNSLERGVLKVVGGPKEIVEALQFETDQVRAEREAAAAKNTEMLDRRQDRDYVGLRCIGPAPAGREGTCGRSLIMGAKQQAENPPLCKEHEGLRTQFYLAEAGSRGQIGEATESRDAIVRREWKPVQMTAPQRQMQ